MSVKLYFILLFNFAECVDKSKMTLDNIAMVFAPTVLRSPSEDLNVMVANSLHEKVNNLFIIIQIIFIKHTYFN